MSDLRSTFPLDQAAIRRQVLRGIIADPISWVPLLPPVALYTVLDLPGWMALGLGSTVALGLGGFWKTQWSGLVARQQQAAISAHNARQDRLLAAAALELEQAGNAVHGEWMRRFLEMKQQIEARMHESGTLSSQRVQLEQLVDSLCFEARDQLLQQARTGGPGAGERPHFGAIEAAYATLANAAAELETLLGPGETLPGPASNLEQIAERLREETELARRVHQRLKSAHFSPPEPLAPQSEAKPSHEKNRELS